MTVTVIASNKGEERECVCERVPKEGQKRETDRERERERERQRERERERDVRIYICL